MRYIDGTVEADNVNKIALDLEYTFVRRVFQGEDCIYRVYGFYTRKTTVEQRLQLTFFRLKIGYEKTCHVGLFSASVEGSTMVRPFSETSCLLRLKRLI